MDSNGNHGVPLCTRNSRPVKNCYIQYHNPERFGLIRDDYKTVRGVSKADWSEPTATEIQNNADYMNFMLGNSPTKQAHVSPETYTGGMNNDTDSVIGGMIELSQVVEREDI